MNDITKPCYTMQSKDDQSVEITMYGEIVQSRPTDWWGDPIDGDFIVLDDFMRDLETFRNATELTIRLNSLGGDGYASIAIHNRLREMNAHKTAIVDGVAMSGGSLIMCAADTVKVNPSSIIMVHKCWSYIYGAYNADDLNGLVQSFDAMDKSQMEIYRRKTGMEPDEIYELMSATTYLTGREAIDKGFADELTGDADIDVAASENRRTLFVNGHAFRVGSKAASAIMEFKTVPDAVEIDNKPEKGGVEMPQTLEELRKENPELAAALLSEAQAAVDSNAAQAERQRIADIDAIAALYDDDTVRAAKYGDTACTAQEMTYRAALEMAKQGAAFMRNVQADYAASNAANVGATPPLSDEPKNTDEDLRAAGRNAASNLKKEG